MSDPAWAPDVLGAPYRACTLTLRPDDEGEVVATLVHRASSPPSRRAVLHVHGFADYFFQLSAADFWVSRGYDFYALDLRKYGRSLRPHQSPNYTADLAAYYEELDTAMRIVAAGHDTVVLSAHSTGGLTVPLWVADRKPSVAGIFLNSPWLDMQGNAWVTRLVTPVVHQVGARRPMQVFPRSPDGIYARTLHRDRRGEFDFDLAWKPEFSWPVRLGWLRAIRQGHRRIAGGLDLDLPVLTICSARSGHPSGDDDPVAASTDIVLDVDQIRRRSPLLSRNSHLRMVEGAIHDVTLSPEPARAQVFAELARWLSAYVETGP